ncbi:MAG TPA: GxxExxY protein [Gemmatimonadaceae bacterium]|jgi:GxxExxY protein
MNSDHSSRSEGSLHRPSLLEKELTHEIIGAFYEVYNALGYGFLERLYKRALEIALRRRGLIVEREFPIAVSFQGQEIGHHRLDMFVERRVVVEVKSTRQLTDADRRQLLSSVTAANLDVGLLLHFGPKADFRRILGKRMPNVKRSDPEDRNDP